MQQPQGPPRIGKYELVGEISRGGMGIVFRARDPLLAREVALKVILGQAGERDVERFLREARTLASLRHPNVVDVKELGVERGAPFLVMDLIEGTSLRRAVEAALRETGRPPAPELCAARLAPIARALEACHAQGILHRDLKPDNVLLDARDGRSILVDFGAVKRPGLEHTLTRTGEAIGTPAYMAPEQFDVGDLTPAVDVWALGATLFYCLTGRIPFEFDNPLNLLHAITRGPRPSARDHVPDVPAAYDQLIARCLTVAPAGRPSAGEVAEVLEALGAPRAAARRARPALTALLLLGGVGLAATGAWAGLVRAWVELNDPPARTAVAHLELSARATRGAAVRLLRRRGDAWQPDGPDRLAGEEPLPLACELEPGENALRVEVSFLGKQAARELSVALDQEPPRLAWTGAREGYVVVAADDAARGTVSDPSGPCQVRLDGRALALDAAGAFSFPAGARWGPRRAELALADALGNRATHTVLLGREGDWLLADVKRWAAASAADQDRAVALVSERLGGGYALVETQDYACAGQRQRIATFRHQRTGAELNLIPGRLDPPLAPFLIGRRELSQAEWERLYPHPRGTEFPGPELPVIDVDWDEMHGWLRAAGEGLRLPVNAEWEHAARAGSTTAYYWGDQLDPRYAWYEQQSPQPVRAHDDEGRNAFGLADTSGNVWEQCLDEHSLNRHVVKGGSWWPGQNGPKFFEPDFRGNVLIDERATRVGLRVTRGLGEPTPPGRGAQAPGADSQAIHYELQPGDLLTTQLYWSDHGPTVGGQLEVVGELRQEVIAHEDGRYRLRVRLALTQVTLKGSALPSGDLSVDPAALQLAGDDPAFELSLAADGGGIELREPRLEAMRDRILAQLPRTPLDERGPLSPRTLVRDLYDLKTWTAVLSAIYSVDPAGGVWQRKAPGVYEAIRRRITTPLIPLIAAQADERGHPLLLGARVALVRGAPAEAGFSQYLGEAQVSLLNAYTKQARRD
ncbi:MAG: bifunctional serine/threonine-protein kinase/formylglycine-generating enzyme family protein [Planctomycetota bacterium]